jgi:hypothetical protein
VTLREVACELQVAVNDILACAVADRAMIGGAVNWADPRAAS